VFIVSHVYEINNYFYLNVTTRDLYPWVLRYVRVFAIANPSVVCNVSALHLTQGFKLPAIFLHRCDLDHQDRRIVSIKDEYEAVRAQSNGDFADKLGWPLATTNHPTFYICNTFHISVTGEVFLGTSNLVSRFVITSCPSLSVTNRPWKGRGQGHVSDQF